MIIIYRKNLLTLSVVIRVRNAAYDLNLCLQCLARQGAIPNHGIEIIVVDNESDDDSVDTAKRFHAIVESISRQNFSWGRALNMGIARASGEYILIISADVEPIGTDWLTGMFQPMSESKVAAVYGRQIPRSNASIDEVVRLAASFPSGLDSTENTGVFRTPSGKLRFLSNACALIRRSAWEIAQFDEDCKGGEEHIWMETLLERGYVYAYAANALAYHSHRDPYGRAGYRVWELHREMLSQQGKTPTFGNVFYAVAALCKRRLKNVLYANASMRSRIEGIFSLPFEITAFSTAAVLEGLGADRRAVRNWMWG